MAMSFHARADGRLRSFKSSARMRDTNRRCAGLDLQRMQRTMNALSGPSFMRSFFMCSSRFWALQGLAELRAPELTRCAAHPRRAGPK